MTISGRLRLAAAATAAASIALTGCTGTEGQATATTTDGRISYLNYGDFGGGTQPKANYNPFLLGSVLGGYGYVFEPLMMTNTYTCDAEPWLATDYEWVDDSTLRYTLREGVKWNDGEDLTAEDVAFTFNMLRDHAALDTTGAWAYLDSVTAEGNTVTMKFQGAGAPAFTLVNDVRIVPEHVWSKVEDPTTFANAEDPVGTGPFTIGSLSSKQLVIERNADYWQADKVKVDEIRFNKADGGGQVDQLKLSRGEYDHNAMFVPDIEKSYVARDPEHNHYWYPPGGTISVYMNLTEAPFDDTAFRTALLTAFDKQEVAEKAQLGYVEQASQTGLVIPGQEDWVPEGVEDDGVMPYDVDAADRALTEAGYETDAQGRRLGKDGKPISFSFKVPGEWTDWVAAAEILVEDLRELGFDVNLERPTPESYDADRASGSYDMLFGVHGGSCNIYRNFNEPLGSANTAPVGEPAASNFVRWQDPETDAALDELRRATTEDQQKEAVADIAEIMVDEAPVIPVWYGAKWFQYSTQKAVGWPNAEDPYAGPADNLLIITNLRPANEED
ncbi:MAG TPA: ABC transporter substrate-binding protein [Nocardioidaceae bacterium]|nr:ABC transporter substrate-binding protein [Nocardioidaceae bacterium]